MRLSINDLSPDGAQPFHDAANEVHAVVNGELYDHERIRTELKEKTGYKFKSRSDCEIVIALYQYYGIGFLCHLRGEFALCLYDERNQIFITARDRYGIKPMFWTRVGNKLLFAAEAKAFRPFGWEPEWDVRSIKEGGWNFDQRTIFKGVNKIKPGQYMIVRRDGTMEQMPYWDIDFPNKNVKETRTEQEMIEGVRERLLDSIRLRLRADVPVGVYLSGGIDSSVIAGMVTHLIRERGEKIGNDKETERVSCFSIAFDEDSGFDESAIANRTAEHLGVKYYKKHMNEAELAARFEDATWHCEHQNPDLNYVGKYALSEVPQELGYKVVLTGEGADETYAGYPMYLADCLREPDLAWPSTLPDKDRAEKCKEHDNDVLKYYHSVGAKVTTSEQSLPRRMLNNIMTAPSMTAFTCSTLLADWTNGYGPCDQQLTIADAVPAQILSKIQHEWHPLNSALYVWTKGHLANIFLSCLGDRTEMAHSIEARTPFLDHELTEYVYGLPPSVKIKWDANEERFVEKWILREAAKPFITKELYERKKHVCIIGSVQLSNRALTVFYSHTRHQRHFQWMARCTECFRSF